MTGTDDSHESVAYPLCVFLVVNVNIKSCELIAPFRGACLDVAMALQSTYSDEPAPLSILNDFEGALVESHQGPNSPFLLAWDRLIDGQRAVSKTNVHARALAHGRRRNCADDKITV